MSNIKKLVENYADACRHHQAGIDADKTTAAARDALLRALLDKYGFSDVGIIDTVEGKGASTMKVKDLIA